MRDRARVKTDIYNEVAVDITVTDRGYFLAEVGDVTLSDSTLDGLEGQIKAAVKKQTANVRVPFVKLDTERGDTLKRAVAHGLDARNRDPLAKYVDGSGKVDFGYVHRDVIADLSDEELREGQELLTAHLANQEAWEQFKSDHSINLRDAVSKAVNDALEKGDSK